MSTNKVNTEWIASQQGKHFCHCGCGQLLEIKVHHRAKGIPRFLPDHRILGTRHAPATGTIPAHLPPLYVCGHPRTVENSYFGKNDLHKCKTCSLDKCKRAGYRKTERGRYAKNLQAKRYNLRLRLQFIEAYGGKCSCCGEVEVRFLTMEHINNGGNDERRRYGKLNKITGNGTGAIITRLRREGWPQGRYTVLCWNCNMARAYDGICPHKKNRPSEL